MRYVYLALGWLFFCIGFVGAFLPVLPTTPFMILSLWCFAKGSERLHKWLMHHRIFGPTLRKWDEHRVIPLPAKIMSVSFMTGSIVYLQFFSGAPTISLIVALAIVVIGCWYILGKPSRPPGE